MKCVLVAGLLSLIIFISGCTSTVSTNPRNLASSVSIRSASSFVLIDNTSKILIKITSNESIANATIAILLPENLTDDNNVTWTGDINKNEPILIETPVNENASGNYSIETVLQTSSTEFTGDIASTTSVEVIPSNTTAVTEVGTSGGSGGANWDPCETPRTYQACVTQFSCFNVDQPRKGENFTSYFASLNITDEYIYGMLQFDGCWGLPEDSWKAELWKDNFKLFSAMGDHTFFFKAPRNILTTKSYDFIRWAGVVEDPNMKIWPDLMDDIKNRPNESVRFGIVAYEVPTEEQYQKILVLINELPPYSDRNTYMSVIANASQIIKIAELGFTKEFEKWYPYIKSE